MTSLSQDVRYSLRMLLKHKGFTIVSALTLALGIGINTAMFSVLNTFLFGSLPYPQSEQLVRVWRTSPHSQSWPFSAANFFDQHDQNTVFEKMAAYNFTSRSLTEQGQTAERLLGLAATADFFSTLGVAPARGRVFKPEEFEPGSDSVIVLTDRFWTRRFGSDPNIVGRKIQLDGKTVEIVGVMPPGFEHPSFGDPSISGSHSRLLLNASRTAATTFSLRSVFSNPASQFNRPSKTWLLSPRTSAGRIPRMKATACDWNRSSARRLTISAELSCGSLLACQVLCC